MGESEERNKQVVRSFFETLSSGDYVRLADLFDPQATWTVCAQGIPGAGTHAGRDAIIDEFLAPVRGTFEPGDPKLEIKTMLGEGSWVAVEARGRGRYLNGNPYDQEYCYLIEVDGGKVRTLRQYFDSHYVAKQMGLGA